MTTFEEIMRRASLEEIKKCDYEIARLVLIEMQKIGDYDARNWTVTYRDGAAVGAEYTPYGEDAGDKDSEEPLIEPAKMSSVQDSEEVLWREVFVTALRGRVTYEIAGETEQQCASAAKFAVLAMRKFFKENPKWKEEQSLI